MRRASRRDGNEGDTIKALLERGATVQQLNEEDVPDLLVGYKGGNYLLEQVGDEKWKKYRQDEGLSPGQVSWHARWKGQVTKVRSPLEAVRAIPGMKW